MWSRQSAAASSTIRDEAIGLGWLRAFREWSRLRRFGDRPATLPGVLHAYSLPEVGDALGARKKRRSWSVDEFLAKVEVLVDRNSGR